MRNTFGSNGSAHGINVSPLAVAHAYGHAKDVIWFERSLGLFVEPHLQHWYLSLPQHGFIRFWNIYYGTFHFIVPIIALVWLFRHDPVHYARWRNTVAITTALALIGFAGYSLMPPRLLDSTMVYGACNARYGLTCHHYGIVDTLVRYGGLWNFDSGTVANVSNQYAAMPSLHIGWSTWCALVLVPRVRHTWTKVLVALYPVITFFCILVTGNHYWVDAVAGSSPSAWATCWARRSPRPRRAGATGATPASSPPPSPSASDQAGSARSSVTLSGMPLRRTCLALPQVTPRRSPTASCTSAVTSTAPPPASSVTRAATFTT